MQPRHTTLHITEPKKHSVRYDNRSEDAAIRTLYISKSALPTPFPQIVEITITVPPQSA